MLQRRFREAPTPEWRTYGVRRYLYYEEIGSEGSQMHYNVSGEGSVLLLCSFAYDPVLLDEELSRDEVEAALEEVDAILESLTIEPRHAPAGLN